MAMASPLNGEASVFVTSEDSQVYLVVASVPEFFGSYQHYPYRIRILEPGECLSYEIFERKLNRYRGSSIIKVSISTDF